MRPHGPVSPQGRHRGARHELACRPRGRWPPIGRTSPRHRRTIAIMTCGCVWIGSVPVTVPTPVTKSKSALGTRRRFGKAEPRPLHILPNERHRSSSSTSSVSSGAWWSRRRRSASDRRRRSTRRPSSRPAHRTGAHARRTSGGRRSTSSLCLRRRSTDARRRCRPSTLAGAFRGVLLNEPIEIGGRYLGFLIATQSGTLGSRRRRT